MPNQRNPISSGATSSSQNPSRRRETQNQVSISSSKRPETSSRCSPSLPPQCETVRRRRHEIVDSSPSAEPVTPGSNDVYSRMASSSLIEDDVDCGDTNSNPRKRKRVQISGSGYGNELYPKIQRLNRLIRWHYFMEFNTKKIHEVIAEVLGVDVSPDDNEYSMARQRVLEWTKGWKSKTLNLMLQYVREEKVQARQVVGLNIVNVDNIRDLASHFRQKFISEKFYQVFYWMKDYISVDESSSLGKFYIKNVFANLATQVKLYDDLCEQNNNDAMVAKWCEILDFWNDMSTAKQYKEVDRGVFKEKIHHQREVKKSKRLSKPIAELLSFDEEAPAKTSMDTTRF